MTVGPHGADETVHVALHYGNDCADTRERLDSTTISCGPGMDTAITDAFDTVFLAGARDNACNDGAVAAVAPVAAAGGGGEAPRLRSQHP